MIFTSSKSHTYTKDVVAPLAMSTNIHQELYTEWWRSSPSMTPSLLPMHDEKCHPRNAQSQETHAAPWGLPDESTSDGVHSRGDSCQQPAFRTELSPYTRSIAWKEADSTVG